jgi:protein-disulfide isomerase
MRLLPAAFAAAALFAATSACSQEAGPGNAAMVAGPEGPNAATLGDPDAPVEIVEYASTTCPHCAAFHMTLFPHIKAEWIDTGRAKLRMRPLPTAPAELAVAGFQIARCAGPERYFDVLGDLFETQDQLVEAAQGGTLEAYFNGVAERHGVAAERVPDCFGDADGIAQINASLESANRNSVNSTPSFLIDGILFEASDLPDTASWDATLQAAFDAH